MNKQLTCIAFLCITFSYTAQNEEIIHFQKLHPEVSFISKDRYNSFTLEEIDLLKNKYVLFDDKIENGDLTDYEERNSFKLKSVTTSNPTEMSVEQHTFVKIWIVNHPHVKIVKHSEYEALSEEDKIVYTNNHCLILMGEFVTLTDIELYPY